MEVGISSAYIQRLFFINFGIFLYIRQTEIQLCNGFLTNTAKILTFKRYQKIEGYILITLRNIVTYFIIGLSEI